MPGQSQESLEAMYGLSHMADSTAMAIGDGAEAGAIQLDLALLPVLLSELYFSNKEGLVYSLRGHFYYLPNWINTTFK